MTNDAYPWIAIFIALLLIMLILSLFGFERWGTY